MPKAKPVAAPLSYAVGAAAHTGDGRTTTFVGALCVVLGAGGFVTNAAAAYYILYAPWNIGQREAYVQESAGRWLFGVHITGVVDAGAAGVALGYFIGGLLSLYPRSLQIGRAVLKVSAVLMLALALVLVLTAVEQFSRSTTYANSVSVADRRERQLNELSRDVRAILRHGAFPALMLIVLREPAGPTRRI